MLITDRLYILLELWHFKGHNLCHLKNRLSVKYNRYPENSPTIILISEVSFYIYHWFYQ